MTATILLYVGSIAITLWGIGHLFPTKSVVAGFGALSDDNRRIITMEWIAEGLTLCFIGLLGLIVLLTAGPGDPLAATVFRATVVMLVALAAVSALTGARTPVLPMKLCPFVKTAVAILFVLGSAL